MCVGGGDGTSKESLETEKTISKSESTNTGEGSYNITDYMVYIHDDGSNDNTVSIIHSYVEKYPDKFILIEGPPTGGAKNNFFYLMREVLLGNEKKNLNQERQNVNKPRYFFFCDQDDVWLEDKLQKELSILKELEKNGQDGQTVPSLVWCDMKVVNDKLNVISKSFSLYSHLTPGELSLDRCIMHGKAAGCSMACNALLVKMLCEIIDSHNVIMHDWALFLIARMVGRVQYIDIPLVLYRQHSGNKLGAKNEGMPQTVASVIRRLFSMKQMKATQTNLIRYIAQIASLNQIKTVYQAQQELIDGAIGFKTMSRTNKVRYVNKFKLYRHKYNKLWTSIAAFLIT